MKTGREYLRVFRLRWKIVALGLLLGTAAGVCVTAMSEPEYAATSTIFITGRAGESDATTAYQASLLSEQKVQSYVALFAGDRVAQDVAAGLGADPQAGQAAVRDRITAVAKPGTALLTLTVTDTSPERARQIADAAGGSFVRLVAEIEQPADRRSPPPLEARIVEAARTPVDPVSPRPLANALLGAFVGLLVGGAAAVARSALDTTLRSAGDLRSVIDAPVLGRTIEDGRISDRPLVVLEEPESDLAESFRTIRNTLQFLDDEKPHRVLTVTSSLPGEGKTTTACNLAIALAQTGARVAVVGADLRSTRLADHFGLYGSAGVVDVLEGRQRLESTVELWCQSRLEVLVGGARPAHPSDVVASRGMTHLIAELRASHDYVIIDSPALSALGDAAVLAANSDGAILVVRFGKTSLSDIESALSSLASVTGRVVGTVLTMVPPPRAQRNTVGSAKVEDAHLPTESELWLRERRPTVRGSERNGGPQPSPTPRPRPGGASGSVKRQGPDEEAIV